MLKLSDEDIGTDLKREEDEPVPVPNETTPEEEEEKEKDIELNEQFEQIVMGDDVP